MLSSPAGGCACGDNRTYRKPRTHATSPETLRSRVFGTSNALLFLAAPIGTVIFGEIAQSAGVLAAVGAMCFVWLGMGVAVRVIPVFGQLEPPTKSL